jgi:cell division protein FtsZ
MHEIHQIAKIVTDSVDPEAKIIFGPIHDEKLKKGEIKVTVIATGFVPQKKNSSNTQQQTPFFKKTVVTEEAAAEPQLAEERPLFRPETQTQPKVLEEIGEDDEDWSAVPAFLRRKK